jgi:hypothetical protein
MAKHRSAVCDICRASAQNVASACNTGGSSSLDTRMNSAARLMQPLRCGATDLIISVSCSTRDAVKLTEHARTTREVHSTLTARASR